MKKAGEPAPNAGAASPPELVIITGMSGSGKGSVLRALEDLGYYSVDNLPVDLIPKLAELVRDATTTRHAALVIDVREGRRAPQVSRHIPSDPGQRECPAALS